jgi:hypothetical protein
VTASQVVQVLELVIIQLPSLSQFQHTQSLHVAAPSISIQVVQNGARQSHASKHAPETEKMAEMSAITGTILKTGAISLRIDILQRFTFLRRVGTNKTIVP